MKRLKVLTVVGTRPEVIRLSRVIRKLDEHCDHVLVHTGQNYDFELNENIFRDLEIRAPQHFLNAARASSIETIANVMVGVDAILAQETPEALLVLGDTNSSMAVVPAKRRKIPIFHMEAGNRCFDQRVPEEINRRIVDHIADINLTYSSVAREYLLREGLPPELVIKTGSPMLEVLSYYRAKIKASNAVERLGLTEGNFFLVSVHREENIEPDYSFFALIEMLNYLAKKFGLPIVVSTHPRTQKRISGAGRTFHENVQLLKPLSFTDYSCLQLAAKAVLSDSGTITEESSILNFPALNLRESHERPEGMEEGTVMLVGFNIDRILQGLSILESQSRGKNRTLRLVGDYDAPTVSEKVVRIIHSYADYVNRVVWKRY
jgi:UDP-N-acetylglucosamine 2-epimerase (non-hydrolysing)